ncbi:MAG: hypothetical protein KAW01_05630 [Deltaproteobacteria bacterium]|nr:hypothetical protein [Deltaproteobacteria bacterium]
MALKRREVDFKRDFEVNFNGSRLFDFKRYVEDIKTLAGDEFPLMGKQEKLIGDGKSLC